MKKLLAKFALAALLAAPLAGLLPLAAHAAGTLFVDPAGNDANTCLAPGAATACLTIQAAIAKTVSGDTVQVAAGTYTLASDIGISNGITLIGANVGVDPNTGSRASETIIDGSGSARIRISTTEPVIVDGFTLTGLNLDSYTTGSQITYQYNKIANLPGNMFFNAPHTYTLKNNHIYGTAATWDALLLAGNWNGTTGTTATIQNNVLDNASTAQGLNLSDVSGTVSNNTFSNIADYGILVASNSSSLTISSNTFANIITTDPTVTTWGAGIRFFTPALTGPVTITGNTFTNNVVGVAVRPDPTADDLSTVTVSKNAFTGNTIGVLNAPLDNQLDANCNWWGNASGPGPVGPGSGDKISTGVTASTWLTSSSLTSACNGPLPVLVPSVTTNNATGITIYDATLNGTNGPVAADGGTSFWVSTSTFSTVSPTIPAGVYSTPVLSPVAANTAFSASLSSITTTGVPTNLPAITPGTTYYFAAWSEVSGTWYPGAVLSFITPALPASCPAGTAPVLVETVPVNSASSAPTPSNNSLSTGQTYLLVSSGTWQNSNLNAADTAYASVDNWTTYMEGYNIAPYFLGTGEFQLQVNSAFVNWGSYSPTHTYSYLYTGTGAVVNLGVFDGDDSNPAAPVANPGWYGDNSGSLSVAIYSCNPTTGSLTVQKDANGGNGTFNFTGSNSIGSFSITTTGGSGSQTFSNLTPGTYSVTESSAKGWTIMDNECTSVVVAAGAAPVCIISNTNNKLLGEIRGTKYEDRDGDGTLKDGDHHRLSSWTINLYKSSAPSTLIASTNTDGHGNYHFSGLVAGSYVVSEVMQGGWKQTVPGGTGSYTVSLSAGQIAKHKDFGNFNFGTISGMKYNDLNGDGRKESNEPGLSGWKINLKGPGLSGPTITTTTDASGNYSFIGLKAGMYTLSEVIPSATPAWHQTQHPGTVKIQSGTNMAKANFGNTQRPANKYGGFFDFGNNYRNNGFR